MLFVASTAAPLESKSSAASMWPLSAAMCSGVAPQAAFPGPSAERPKPRRRRKLNKAELHRFNRQTNDECFWTQHLQICSRQKNNHKQSQTHSTSFNTSCFRQITFNETMSINMVYFHKLNRLFKTITSSKSNIEQLIT